MPDEVKEWQPIETAPEGALVDTRLTDHQGTRNWQPLIRKGKLWFTPDMRMYVYYTPTEWRPV